MTINLQKPDITELKPRITVFGVGGGGGNAVNNMIASGLDGVEFVVANTDAQALTMSKAERLVQMGVQVTEGLGAGSQPEVGAAAAQECLDEIKDHLTGTHMCFVTAGMGGGTGTGAAPVVAEAAREMGILTVGVVTKPFSFEGKRRMTLAEAGIEELQKCVDTLIVIPNQNLFHVANEKTTFADAFSMADQVLYSGVACITDLMVKEGLINLDFADVRSVMQEMGRAMMGTGEASGEGRAMAAAEASISNPLLDETSMAGSQGLLISITGGRDMTLFEVDEAATRIREEVDADANIILGATFDESLEGIIRVSVVATGIDAEAGAGAVPNAQRMSEAAERLRQSAALRSGALSGPAAVPSMETPLVDEVEDPVAASIQIERHLSGAVPFEPEEATFSEPISDSDFASALEEEIAIPAAEEFQVAAKAQPVDRVPAVEEFPAVAQKQLNAEEKPVEDHGPMGLLKRLATGLGGGAGASASGDAGSSTQTPTTQPSTTPAPVQRTVAPSVTTPAAPVPTPPVNAEAVAAPSAPAMPVAPAETSYAPPKNGSLDIHGRSNPSANVSTEEDQLDIPAFLRRQA